MHDAMLAPERAIMTGMDAMRDDLLNRTDVFKALSDPVRLDLLVRIAAVNEISCTDLVADADVTASTVSYHVKILKAAELVAVRKQGRNYHYAAKPAALIEIAALLNLLATTKPARRTKHAA